MGAVHHLAAHGGMYASSAPIATSVGAALRPSYGQIRVWTHNWRASEDFTIAEAHGLCARIDAALAMPSDGGSDCGVWIDHDGLKVALTAPRLWFIAFLAAVRRELRKHHVAAQAAIAMQVDC